MAAQVSIPEATAARITMALGDADRRRVNAEQIARFLQDDLTEARAQLETQANHLEVALEENRRKRITLNAVGKTLETVRDLVREGRTQAAEGLLSEAIAMVEK